MKRWGREIFYTLFLGLLFAAWIFLTHSSLSKEREQEAAEILKTLARDINRAEFLKALETEKIRQHSFQQYQENPEELSEYQLEVLAADAIVAGRLEGNRPYLKAFVIEEGHPGLGARIKRILSDLAAHRDDFEFQEEGTPRILATPILADQRRLHAAISFEVPDLQESIGWYTPLLFLLALALGYQFLGLQKARRQGFSRFSRRFLPVAIFLLGAMFVLLKEPLSHQNRVLKERAVYRGELAMLKGVSTKNLKLGYQEIRQHLPFAEDAIYHLEKVGGTLLFQPHKNGLRGFFLSDSYRIMDALYAWLALAVFFLVLLELICRRAYRNHLLLSEEIRESMGEDELSPVELTEPELYGLQESFVKTREMIRQREIEQRLMARDVLMHLTCSLGFRPGSSSWKTDAWGLVLQIRDPQKLNDLSARDFFSAYSEWLQVIRSAARKVEGIVAREQGLGVQVLFASAGLGKILMQRALVAALDVQARIRREAPVFAEAGLVALVQFGELEVELADTRHRQDILLGGRLMERLDGAGLGGLREGIFIPLQYSQEARSLVFVLEEHGDYLQVHGVKSLNEHLELLAVPSSELRSTALQLAQLQPGQETVRAILGYFPDFSDEERKKASEVLRAAMTVPVARQNIEQQVQDWLHSTDDNQRKLAFYLYGQLDLELSTEEASTLLTLEGLVTDQELLALILRHWKGESRPEWSSRLEQSEPLIQAEWAWQCLIRFGDENSIPVILEILEDEDLLERYEVLGILSRLKDVEAELRFQLQNGLNRVRPRFYSVLSTILKSAAGRQDLFVVLSVIASWELTEFIPVLVEKYRNTLDRDLKREIRETLALLGADRFLVSRHVLH